MFFVLLAFLYTATPGGPPALIGTKAFPSAEACQAGKQAFIEHAKADPPPEGIVALGLICVGPFKNPVTAQAPQSKPDDSI